MDPGTILAVLSAAYSGASVAWKLFRNGLHYHQDSEDLAFRLELERIRFKIWGANAGLAKNRLHPSLEPIHELLAALLRRLKNTFEDADQLKDKFGMSSSDADGQESSSGSNAERLKRFVSDMRNSLKSSGVHLDASDKERLLLEDETDIEPLVGESKPSAWMRIRWSVRDKARFQELISGIELNVRKLNELLTEALHQAATEDWKRVNILVIGNVQDESSLKIVQAAVQNQPETSPIRQLVERKAIAKSSSLAIRSGAAALQKLELSKFSLSHEYSFKDRFIAADAANIEALFLFEKKEYDPDIDARKKQLLARRVHNLVLMLSARKSQDFNTLHAIGYVHDPAHFCWWLVFNFPVKLSPGMMATSTLQPLSPVSLALLLDPAAKYPRPPLEKRFQLASKLAGTFSELYSSTWLHKGVRSDNIIFPLSYQANGRFLFSASSSPEDLVSSPYVIGFNYSRQDTEAQTIDKAKQLADIRSALYRHPNYQGDAAGGYRMQYDIYSLGLVLAEIAWWEPLLSVLGDKLSSHSKSPPQTNAVKLSPNMTRFHREEATELKKRAIARDLAFRVGTRYAQAVKWCLTFADQCGLMPGGSDESRVVERGGEGEDEGGDEWPPALEFYNNVVIPLSSCAKLAQKNEES